MSKSLSTIAEFPKDLQTHIACWLLHEHMSYMDEKGMIRTICKECTKAKNEKT